MTALQTLTHDDVRAEGNGPLFRIARWLPWEDVRVQQLSLLALLDTLHRERTEPAPFVAALAEEHRGPYRVKLNALAKRLEKGVPLVEALEQTPDALSDEMVLALRLGSQSGTLSDSYAMLLESHNKALRHREFGWRSVRGYWIVVGLVMLVVLSFFGYFIVPKFRRMADEMAWAPPASFFIYGNWYDRVVWILALLLILSAASAVLGWSSRVRRWFRQTLLPKLGLVANSEALAPTLRMLSVSVQGGRPIVGSLSTLAKYHYNQRLRQQLLLARNEIEQGENDWESLRVSGVLQPSECHALQVCDNAPSRAWILQQLAEKHVVEQRQRQARRYMFIQPVMAILFGGLVLWLAYSVFGTIYGLAQSLA